MHPTASGPPRRGHARLRAATPVVRSSTPLDDRSADLRGHLEDHDSPPTKHRRTAHQRLMRAGRDSTADAMPHA